MSVLLVDCSRPINWPSHLADVFINIACIVHLLVTVKHCKTFWDASLTCYSCTCDNKFKAASAPLNPLDAGRRYTGILQPLKRRQIPVYRGYVNIQASPDPGIPGLRKHTSLARPRYTGIIF